MDDFQSVDAAQLLLVRALAAPQHNLFVDGDHQVVPPAGFARTYPHWEAEGNRLSAVGIAAEGRSCGTSDRFVLRVSSDKQAMGRR